MTSLNKETTYLVTLKKYYGIGWALACLFSVLLVIVGYLFFAHTRSGHVGYSLYPYLSKRVFIQDSNDLIINFVPLRKALKDYVDSKGGTLGVYFEYLPSGSSIGAQDTNSYKLASLSKVPLAMSILKKVEKGEIALDTKITLKKEHINTTFGELWKRGVGTQLTVQELVEAMLKQSDNTAYEVIFSLLSTEEVLDVYDDLEIEVESKDADPHVSPKSYSSILRSLYLSTYLSKVNSNYILEVLADTNFSDKLPAGVPKNITISHKIGVFSIADQPNERLFSDCGIVYYPLRPYILCVFSKSNEETAKEQISLVSRMVYGYIDMVRNGNQE